DAQSIYGFRGASHDNIMNFPKQFPGCRILKLEENYRSTQAILDVGNAILENMTKKFAKSLVSAHKTRGEKPEMLFFKDAYREAEWIARRIKDHYDEGTDLAHQAVLFRNLYISIPLQAELNKRNIPYQVFGGMKFYETAHVKDVIAHLKVIANPKDELSWTRILTLIEGIGPKKSEIITEEIMKTTDMDHIISVVLEKAADKFKSKLGLRKLGATLKSAMRKGLSVGEKFIAIQDYYDAILHDKFDDWHIRINDLEAMRQISERYKSLSELLADFAIEPPERGVGRVGPVERADVKPLTISTIHSAKGLEWDAVFFMGIMEGVLPSKFSVDDEEEVEEEQRLFYVGVTRAKRHLSLSLHHEGVRGGISQFNRLSRFVEAPNVAARLDPSGYGSQDVADYIDDDLDEDDMLPVHDKNSLLKKILDGYK
ncbi:MAG: ATP-dependent helicase, partial [Candidatus Omnitrophota bacterium]